MINIKACLWSVPKVFWSLSKDHLNLPFSWVPVSTDKDQRPTAMSIGFKLNNRARDDAVVWRGLKKQNGVYPFMQFVTLNSLSLLIKAGSECLFISKKLYWINSRSFSTVYWVIFILKWRKLP